MTSDEVYIIFPGLRDEEMEGWYTVRTVSKALLQKGIKSRLICFDDYSESEFLNLPKPRGAVFIHVFTYLVYNRFNKIIQMMNNWNTVFVNSCTAHYNVSNKARMYSVLQQNGLPVAKSVNINNYSNLSEEECNRIFSELGSPVVLKPAYGFFGIATFLCYTAEDLIKNLNILRNEPNIGKFKYSNMTGSPAVIQEYVGDYPDMFIRVYITPTYTKGFLSLVSPFEKTKFLNYNKFRFRIPYKIQPELEDYVRKCMKCLNMNVGACDVLIRDNGFALTDVNSPGNYKVFDAICNTSFGDEIANYLYSKIK